MSDLLERLALCRRPKLLISAARIGSFEYVRKSALYRLLGVEGEIAHASALGALMELEEELDTLRRAHDATYSVARHVEVLASVMGEARLHGNMSAPDAPDCARPDTLSDIPASRPANKPTRPLTLDAM